MRIINRQLILLVFNIAIELICVVPLLAQEDDIATDRPDQGDSPYALDRGLLQIETGVMFTRREFEFFSGAGYLNTSDYATTMVRYGLGKEIELRLASGYTVLTATSSSIEETSGLQPISIGAKIGLAKERGLLPQIGFIGTFTLPGIGHEAYRPDRLGSDFRLSCAHSLSERFGLGYNIGVNWDGLRSGGRFLYTLSVESVITGPVKVFAEVYGIPDVGRTLHNVDAGMLVLIKSNLQLDIAYGFGLREDFRFFTAGVSFRFDGRD